MEGKSTEDFEAIAEAAISGGQWELVKSCLGRGMSKALMNRALVEALKSGQWDTVLECVQRGVSIAGACAENGLPLHDKGRRDQTVLHSVIQIKSSLEVVELLLQAGADPDVADTFGKTALHTAVER